MNNNDVIKGYLVRYKLEFEPIQTDINITTINRYKNVTKQLTNFNYIFKDLNALKCFKLKTANHTSLKYLHGMNMKLASKHYSKLE